MNLSMNRNHSTFNIQRPTTNECGVGAKAPEDWAYSKTLARSVLTPGGAKRLGVRADLRRFRPHTQPSHKHEFDALSRGVATIVA